MRKILLAILIILALLISSCGKKEATTTMDPIRTGSSAISMIFSPNNPPPEIHIDNTHPDNTFTVTLELRNQGAYPQPSDTITGLGPKGRVFISGYDPSIIDFQVKEQSLLYADLSRMALEGRSTINPNGGMDIVSFSGKINYPALNVKTYEPILMATGCFYYETIAETQVCIDPNPYTVDASKKVCTVQDKPLGTQGAPVAVTTLNSEPFASKTQFKISIKNVGGGDVLKEEAISKCNPPSRAETGKIERTDLDKVKFESAKIADIPLYCGPFADDNPRSFSGYVKMINGEGYVICELPSSSYATTLDTYTTPITIKLSYGYRTSMQRSLRIIKD